MATYGLTANGFVPKTFEIIRSEMNQTIWDTYGNSVDLSDRTPLGQLIGIFAEREAQLWEVAEGAYSALDPDAATGAALENLAALTGTLKAAATKTQVDLYLTGTVATAVPSAQQVSVDATGELFTTTEAGTLAAATAWAISTAYLVGDIRSNDSNIYICDVAGTSAGSGGPTGEGTAIVDGTVTWRFVGDGLAYDIVAAEAINTGPIAANAYAITTIETAVAGWDSVQNLTDGTPGTNLATDGELRIARNNEITRNGSSPKDAIRTELLDVAGVTSATVFVNDSDTTDGDGLPPHSIECLVLGGTDQDIFDQILASKGAATKAYGTTSGTATDSQGTAVPIAFTRPASITVYASITLTYDALLYPADGDDQIKEAIVAWGEDQVIGKDVVSSAIKAACFEVPGVLDVSLAYIGTAPAPVSEATIAVSLRELADYDTSRITVTSSAATP